MSRIMIDANKISGPVRPLHGINNAPIIGANDMLFHYIGEAGIPFSRLHDTGGAYGGRVFVDIDNIFRSFDADVNDPASYDFAFTDWLLGRLCEQGAEPFYRLGSTIENYHYIRHYHITPPKDPQKWAEICAHIVAHYNEGWADGFHMGIRYWEIWNEPDNSPDIDKNPMWKGTAQQYFELYDATAKLLKSRWPHLKVGGYASCGFYAINPGGDSANANVSPRTQYFIDFAHDFFRHINGSGAPLDFFSWHSYGTAEDNVIYARYARELMTQYGYGSAESILDEWNPGIKNRGTLKDAALIAGMMCTMHNKTDVYMLNYYDGQVHGSYQGLFDPVHYVPFKAYYVFPAYSALYRLGEAVSTEYSDDEVPAVAAAGKGGCALLIANTKSETESVEIIGLPDGAYTERRICARKNLDKPKKLICKNGVLKLSLSAYNVALIESVAPETEV